MSRSNHSGDNLSKACALLDLEAKYLQEFEAEDPFNPGNVVSGFVARKSDHRYGAMAILKVCGKDATQVVFATPKLHYPFDEEGQFRFPPIKQIHLYEKLDGTNVLSYAYHGAQGEVFRSFKLRLSPFIRNTKRWPFLDHWKEVIARRPAIETVAEKNNCNISFELYGAQNPLLISYDVPLDAALLFGIDAKTTKVIPPHELDLCGLSTPELVETIQEVGDPVVKFQALRGALEAKNSRDGDKIVGSEGLVWYITEASGRVSLWKCKPESVEEIHWAGNINKAAVLATCWNALETADRLTFDVLKPLLLEEYQAADIAAYRKHIDDCIGHVQGEADFRCTVQGAYDEVKASGITLEADKGGVMRALAAKFDAKQMKRVYSALVR